MTTYTRSATVAAPSSSPPWASLHGDLVQHIGWRVLAGDLHGYVLLRAVCTRWRSGTVRPRGRGVTDQRFHPRRWAMLSERRPAHHGKWIRFFNLDTRIFVRVKLPFLRNHRVLDSVDGLLLLLRDKDTAVYLLNPFTDDIAELPPLATLLPQVHVYPPDKTSKWFSITYNICATVSCGGAGITTVMIAFHCLPGVAVATSNDRQWTMSTWEYPHPVEHLSFCGNLYVVSKSSPTMSQIFQIEDIGSRQPSPPRLVATCPPDILTGSLYLVDSDSEEIFAVGRSNICASRILVYKLADLMLGRLVPVTSIGERAIFREERTMCVSSNMFPTVMPETVVYTDRRLQRDVSCYSTQYRLLTSGKSRPINGYELEDATDPGSSSLIYHNMSCSMRNVWNKRWLTDNIMEYQNRLLWKVQGMFRH
ncbi:unnamed protein product [Alopecurus aequalis]